MRMRWLRGGRSVRTGTAAAVSGRSDRQAGTFASGQPQEMKIGPTQRLDVYAGAGGGQSVQFTAELLNGTAFPDSGGSAYAVSPGQAVAFRGDVFTKVVCTNGPAPSVYWALVGLDDSPTFMDGAPPNRSPSANLTATFLTSPTTLIGPHGIVYQDWVNDTAAPESGVLHITVEGLAGTAIQVSDGTNTENLVDTPVTGHWNSLVFNVVKGVTYNITGNTLLILGSKGWVGAA